MTVINTSQGNMSRFTTGLAHVPSSASAVICDDNTAQTKNYNTVTTMEATSCGGVLVRVLTSIPRV